MSTKFYTADFHLWHYNIIRYCNRPVHSIHEMHSLIIDRMNSKVNPNDLLYILGDVSFYAGKKVADILKNINGKKIILIGNHDAKKITNLLDYPEANVIEVTHYKEIVDENLKVVLFHYPIESWRNKMHGSVHLHGHTHTFREDFRDGNLDRILIPENRTNRRYNVGVDLNDFYPVTLKEVLVKFKESSLLESTNG